MATFAEPLSQIRRGSRRCASHAPRGAMEELLNDGQPTDVGESFFVGDSATDREWARNVGAAKGAVMGFESPAVAFGPAAGPCSSNKGSGSGGVSAADASLRGGGGAPGAAACSAAGKIGPFDLHGQTLQLWEPTVAPRRCDDSRLSFEEGSGWCDGRTPQLSTKYEMSFG